MSASVLQSCLTELFPYEYLEFIIIYCDDSLFFTDTSDLDTHMQLIERVLSKLKAVSAKIKLAKKQVCRF